ncbi:MAG: sulfite exporter TauE/SafE family protein [Planctomycetales bacterium]|nr:sulfite exporter TauE/SafE family protein [Planctomycetales bacterium]
MEPTCNLSGFALAGASALWLGVLTSLSPCPLATNIAAMSYVARSVGDVRRVIAAGLLYTLGRSAVYVVLAFVVVKTALSTPGVSLFPQKYVHLFIGPWLIIVGMFLVGLLEINTRGAGFSDALKERVDRLGVWGAGLLGAAFALAFCPTSAALFFGNVMASLSSRSTFWLPMLYGVGTALPVVGFAAVIAAGSGQLGRVFHATKVVERWARAVTGTVFLGCGMWLTLQALAAE